MRSRTGALHSAGGGPRMMIVHAGLGSQTMPKVCDSCHTATPDHLNFRGKLLLAYRRISIGGVVPRELSAPPLFLPLPPLLPSAPPVSRSSGLESRLDAGCWCEGAMLPERAWPGIALTDRPVKVIAVNRKINIY